MSRKLRNRIAYLLTLFFVSFSAITCANTSTNTSVSPDQYQTLQIWWQQGFYPEESEAIQALVEEWKAESGKEAELTLFSDKDIVRETESALTAQNPPTILFNPSIDLSVIPEWAWDNVLSDIPQEVLDTVPGQFSEGSLDTVNYRNREKNGEKSYYAIPLGQQTANIHYWQELLTNAGLASDQIPTDWDGFWKFWRDAQDNLDGEIKGLGLPMAATAGDTFFIFEQFLEARGVQLVNEAGELQRDQDGLAGALAEYVSFYKDGYVPENAIEWENPDNNVAFLSQTSVMTINPSLSIPGSQRQDLETYQERMATVEWPQGVDGNPLQYLAGVKQIVVFEDVAEGTKEDAKDFLEFLIQPENMNRYLKQSQGRFLPVIPALLQDEFWSDPADPHIQVAAKQAENPRAFPQSFNPAYTEVQQDNVWGEAIASLASGEETDPTAVAEAALDKIEAIFQAEKWQMGEG